MVLSEGPAVTSLKYRGEYQDVETGFIYLRARYYDPSTAQFLTRDPLATLTRSAYGYVAQSPLNNTDPSGLICKGLYLTGPCAAYHEIGGLLGVGPGGPDFGQTSQTAGDLSAVATARCLLMRNARCVSGVVTDVGSKVAGGLHIADACQAGTPGECTDAVVGEVHNWGTSKASGPLAGRFTPARAGGETDSEYYQRVKRAEQAASLGLGVTKPPSVARLFNC